MKNMFNANILKKKVLYKGKRSRKFSKYENQKSAKSHENGHIDVLICKKQVKQVFWKLKIGHFGRVDDDEISPKK